MSNVIVNITTMSQPDYQGKATRTRYECFVNFGHWEDDEELLRSWLRSFCSTPDEHMTRDILEDHNYARAIAAHYFAEKWERVTENRCTNFVPEDKRPAGEPTAATDKYKLWVKEIEEKVIETAASAAYSIWAECRGAGGKVSVARAKEIFHEKAKSDHGFLWDDVLREFRKRGGSSTDKYLRRN